jgi:hypothetical protein
MSADSAFSFQLKDNFELDILATLRKIEKEISFKAEAEFYFRR